MNLFVERFMEYVAIFFVTYMLLYTTYLIFAIFYGAIRLHDRNRMNELKNEIKHDFYMPISIIVPAFNEEINIVETVTNLLHLDYRLYEIIVVDDGSTDGTAAQMLEAFVLRKIDRPLNKKIQCLVENEIYEGEVEGVQVTFIRKDNGGKSDALNMGINASNFPYFVTIDADSYLQENALEKIIQPVLEDENVIVVGGMIQVAQSVRLVEGKVSKYFIPWHPIVGMQVVEYDRSFLAARILLDQFNGNLIVSGAFGLYKKDIVQAVGGYRTNTIGEDMELVMRLHYFMLMHQYPYKIHYQPQAIAWSQAPYHLTDLFKQRRRWYIGLFQSLTRYPEMITRFRYKPVGFISYVYFWLFELLGSFIEVFGILTIILAATFDLLNVPFMITLFIIYTVYGILLSITAFFQRVYTQWLKLNFMTVLKAMVMIIIENAFFRYVMSFVRMTALIAYNRDRKKWGVIRRRKFDAK